MGHFCPKYWQLLSLFGQRNSKMPFHYFSVSFHFSGSLSRWFSLTMSLLSSATCWAGNLLEDGETPFPDLPGGWWRWVSSGQSPNKSPIKRLAPGVRVVPFNSETRFALPKILGSWGCWERAGGAKGRPPAPGQQPAPANLCPEALAAGFREGFLHL